MSLDDMPTIVFPEQTPKKSNLPRTFSAVNVWTSDLTLSIQWTESHSIAIESGEKALKSQKTNIFL